VVAACVALAAPTSAAGKLAPFGHPCTLENGVFFCPTSNDSQRVRTFDGVPLDVDVTVPTRGLGHPFPTIVMLHGFPGTKQTFEADSPAPSTSPLLYHYNNNFFAKQGYLVVNYSARGFGRSCGDKDSRTPPECNRGWFHLADQRWELRDAQVLLSKLVDQGLTDPRRIGVTGVSYGGGSSLQLAYLKNRIRKRNGDLAPWVSASGKRLSVAAAYPRWGWDDLLYSLIPNGRSESLDPLGVAKQSIIDALYVGGTLLGYLAPKGADPSADLATWREKVLAGEPYGADARRIAKQIRKYKSAVRLPGRPAPLLIMDGWTDPAFNAIEALRPYNRIRRRDDDAFVSLQLGDLGHFRAGNALALYRDFGDEGAAFFARYLKGASAGPRNGSVKVYGQGCPKGTLGPGPFVVSSYDELARGDLSKTKRHGVIEGTDDGSGEFFNPVSNGDPCSTTVARKPNGSVVLERNVPFTLAGATKVSLQLEEVSSYGQIDARLLDVSGGQERLVDYGTYRLTPGQDGFTTFRLAGNVYRFAPGHTARLELVARNEPWFLKDDTFRAELRSVRIDIPTR
jgi:predicted acyl esterase